MRAIPFLATALACLATRAGAQSYAAVPPRVDSAPVARVLVTPGAQYAAGWLHRALFGANYRDLWATPIAVAPLDLRAFAGGLRPLQRGGSMQTKSLRLRGADGREYVFRSIEKDHSASLPPELRETLVRGLYQDQVSAYHPAGALVVARLLDATGIRHVHPVIVLMPDDPALGEFRGDFAGRLGTLEERPGRGFDDSGESDGAAEVASSEALFARLRKRPETRVDTRAFLAARLFDVFVGDRDRHRDQWRWGRFGGDDAAWEPIPRDRDMAFVRYEGLVLAIAKAWNPQLVGFGDAYPGMLGLNWNAREIDRRLLAGLERAAWDSAATALQAALTDAVIADAVAAMPAPLREKDGEALRRALVHRRDALPDAAAAFYALLAREVDLEGSDRADVVEVTRLADGSVDVAMSLRRDGDAAPRPAYLHRRFDARETDEIRLHLHDGDDRVVVHGAAARGMLVRVVGGDGDDLLVDSTDGGRTRFYDASGNDRVVGGTVPAIDRRPYTPPLASRPMDPPRDWGSAWRPAPWTSAAPDVGLFLGAGATRYRYGFRQDPYASRVTLVGGWSLGTGRGRVQLRGDFRLPNAREHVELTVRASGIEVLRWYGLGNGTEAAPDGDRHRVFQSQYLVEPTLVAPIASRATLSLGAVGQYARTEERRGTLLDETRPYGSGAFGQVGARVGLAFDTRDQPVAASRGIALSGGATLYPRLWDVERPFGEAHGTAATYVRLAERLEPTLALRVGGKHVWGTFPFHEAAFLGGASSLRGWGEQRFAGRSSVQGSAELRLFLTRYFLVVPGDLGVFALADAGRVYATGERSDAWHTGFGGGVWIAPLKRSNTLSLAVARGGERTGVYLRSGFGF